MIMAVSRLRRFGGVVDGTVAAGSPATAPDGNVRTANETTRMNWYERRMSDPFPE